MCNKSKALIGCEFDKNLSILTRRKKLNKKKYKNEWKVYSSTYAVESSMTLSKPKISLRRAADYKCNRGKSILIDSSQDGSTGNVMMNIPVRHPERDINRFIVHIK